MAGNFQQLSELPALLWPPRPLPLFFVLSHKAARLLVPFAMITLAVSNLFLLGRPIYTAALAGQAAFYAAVVAGALWPAGPRLLRLPYYFSMINVAAFLGIYYALVGREKMLWKRR